jgi:hypothetical protein
MVRYIWTLLDPCRWILPSKFDNQQKVIYTYCGILKFKSNHSKWVNLRQKNLRNKRWFSSLLIICDIFWYVHRPSRNSKHLIQSSISLMQRFHKKTGGRLLLYLELYFGIKYVVSVALDGIRCLNMLIYSCRLLSVICKHEALDSHALRTQHYSFLRFPKACPSTAVLLRLTLSTKLCKRSFLRSPATAAGFVTGDEVLSSCLEFCLFDLSSNKAAILFVFLKLSDVSIKCQKNRH